MSIKNWLVRGDCHGDFYWLSLLKNDYIPEETAIIILGDAGVNFYLNKTDIRTKECIQSSGFTLYLVRGNHEMRPERLPDIKLGWDEDVKGSIMYEQNYPNIRYFRNYDIYTINNYRCLVIGGAYSVDKWYRLARAYIVAPEYNNPKKTGWFADECLSEYEMSNCEWMIEHSGDKGFDFVFSHTCPKKFQPVDMFLGGVDQSTVDESMEVWMDKIYEAISIRHAWLFGHYHDDRVERPHVEMYFNDIEPLEAIAVRWQHYDETGELDWWLKKSPAFEKGDINAS